MNKLHYLFFSQANKHTINRTLFIRFPSKTLQAATNTIRLLKIKVIRRKLGEHRFVVHLWKQH